MFLLVSIWTRLERFLMPFLKPFHAFAGIESARSAIDLIAFNSPTVSLERIPLHRKTTFPAPAHTSRPS
ncbi:MAG: hypothetical protein HC765_00670 [Brachymonas sp.]|nr:hypothetical protein [Brachymonas sp.]